LPFEVVFDFVFELEAAVPPSGRTGVVAVTGTSLPVALSLRHKLDQSVEIFRRCNTAFAGARTTISTERSSRIPGGKRCP